MDDDTDPVSLAASRLAGRAEECLLVGILRDGARVRVLREGSEPVTLDPTTLDERPFPQRVAGGAVVVWNEVLYDLGAHDQPLRDLGKRLHYLSITRDDGVFVVELTDGVETARYSADLADAAGCIGLPDDLATAFIEHDTSVLRFDRR